VSSKRFLRLQAAATELDCSVDALRKRAQRASSIDADGVRRADLGAGIVAVKLAGSWRVHLPSTLTEASAR
jgi:hypothetical protein